MKTLIGIVFCKKRNLNCLFTHIYLTTLFVIQTLRAPTIWDLEKETGRLTIWELGKETGRLAIWELGKETGRLAIWELGNKTGRLAKRGLSRILVTTNQTCDLDWY